ncbi:MAG: hybrid sensor histidine kinase/response regulator [Chloroflexi bacterium OHK40]
MDLSTFYSQFREETVENVRVLSEGLLALERSTDAAERRATIDRVFRAVHTIKGSARMLGFDAVGRLAHALEGILGELRQERRTLDQPLADALLHGGDVLLAVAAAAVEGRPPDQDVDAIIAGLPGSVVATDGGAPARPAEGPPPTPREGASTRPAGGGAPARQTVRVRVDRLDRMLNLAGELVVGQQVLDTHVDELLALHELVERQSQALAALEAELGRLRFSLSQRSALDSRLAALREATGAAGQFAQRQSERFARHVNQYGLLVRDLEQEVLAARLLPIATIFSGLPRALRDLAQATGKQVQLELRGETVELDRKVLELLNDPLLHLVRNAVDHGIESPAERVAAGKPARGLVEVSAEVVGGEVRLVISDDGRGMHPQQLRDQAVRLGLISAEAASRLSEGAALELIFRPGFSTAPAVTDVSGRGVGLDVVRSNLDELGGHVRVESQPGRGSRIVLTLPLTLVTTRVLLVRAAHSTFALPVSGCQGLTWVYHAHLRTIEGQPTIAHDGRTLSALSLATLIGLDDPGARTTEGRSPAVLVGGPQQPVAVLVDALLDEREVVVKPLGPLFARQRRFSGAVQLGDGSLVLLLNPAALSGAASAQRPLPTFAPARPVRRARLLVADDSFTTRELVRSILESAGYEVAVAIDGLSALEQLRAQRFDLLVSDVEMPRLDGYGLVAQLRADDQLHALPAILITSLASEEHRRRGLEAGAQAYIVKSQFDQNSLLDVVRQLLDGRV